MNIVLFNIFIYLRYVLLDRYQEVIYKLNRFWVWRYSLVVGCIVSMYKVFDLIFRFIKREKKKKI